MAAAGSKPPSNVGCVVAIVALPIVILIGVVIGTVLRSDGDKDEDHVTLDGGQIDGTTWRVDAVRDVDDQTCIFLYEDDADEPLNGTCDLQPQDVTYGNQTIVFGRVDADDTDAEVTLSNDEVITAPTESADGMDGRFYVTVVDGDLDAAALSTEA